MPIFDVPGLCDAQNPLNDKNIKFSKFSKTIESHIQIYQNQYDDVNVFCRSYNCHRTDYLELKLIDNNLLTSAHCKLINIDTTMSCCINDNCRGKWSGIKLGQKCMA
jgi:hypothetical protein